MSILLKAPLLGEGVDELNIGRWLVAEGATVVKNEALVELESDKVVTELRSPEAGLLLRSYVKEGDVVKVGDRIALIGKAGEKDFVPAAPDLPMGTELVETKKTKTLEASPSNRFLSPVARKLSALHGVDPAQVTGTGLAGRVTKQDILDFVAAGQKAASPSPAPTSAATPVKDLVQPHSSARSRIAERMVDSLRISAHVLTVMEADLSAVVEHRVSHKEEYAKEGVRLTLTSYFLAASAAALRKNPTVNASWTDTGLVMHPSIDIGLAVSLGDLGLVAPVLRNVGDLSLMGIARGIDDLAKRARERKLTPDEVRNGTFTVTNHGSNGSLFATPIINQPQVGILGVGTVTKRVVVVEGPRGTDSIAIRPMAYLSFVFDHRVMDGEAADRFLATVKEALENWA
ncbi:2-oxo acid dehydrogenase subunit E2 [Treponema sp.]